VAKESSSTNNLYKFVVAVLFVFLVVLRFWKAGEWFSFNFDEEYQAFLAWSQVQDFHPIWIGVSAGNTGFYLGPAFTYLNALLFFFSGGDPLILAYFAPLLGLATVISLYFVSSQLFSPSVAIFSSLIYAGSPLLNFFDRRFWNPSPIPLLTIWLLYSLYKSQKDTRWFILVSAIMATVLHVHLSLLMFWPVIIFLVFKSFKRITFSTWISSVVVYLVLISPLLVFDKVHNFDNLRTPLRMLTSQSNTSMIDRMPGRLSTTWNSLSRFWYLRPRTSVQAEMGFGGAGTPTGSILLLSSFSLGILVLSFFRAKIDKKFCLLFVMLIISITSYLLYPGNVIEYYLLSFFTLFSIFSGTLLSSLSPKISWFLILILVFFSAITIFTCEQSKYGLISRRERIIKITKDIQNQPYSIILGTQDEVGYSAYGGWCYLFRTYAGNPLSCPADEAFGWIYGVQKSNNQSSIKINLLRDLGI